MEKYLEVLRSVPLFRGIEQPDLRAVLSCLSAKTAHYEKNQMIFPWGAQISSFGIVLSGQVQVYQDDYFGNRSIFAVLGPGELFGESFACAQEEALPFSVMASAESELLFIDCGKLAAPCANACGFHSALIRNLLHITAMKNIALTQKIEVTSRRTTREKLLAYLSAEARAAQSSRFQIPFNRQELADYLSVDRSAMSAELSKLRSQGVLSFHKNQFQLLKS